MVNFSHHLKKGSIRSISEASCISPLYVCFLICARNFNYSFIVCTCVEISSSSSDECLIDTGDDCATNPCGPNAFCENRVGGFQCTCNPGCSGDPSDGSRGCTCPRHNWQDACKRVSCGRNAKCRANFQGQPACYCPTEFPDGDPRVECKADGEWNLAWNEFLYFLFSFYPLKAIIS